MEVGERDHVHGSVLQMTQWSLRGCNCFFCPQAFTLRNVSIFLLWLEVRAQRKLPLIMTWRHSKLKITVREFLAWLPEAVQIQPEFEIWLPLLHPLWTILFDRFHIHNHVPVFSFFPRFLLRDEWQLRCSLINAGARGESIDLSRNTSSRSYFFTWVSSHISA